MRILGRAGGDKPRAARQVRGLGYELKSSVVGISPEGLDPADGRLLNRTVIAVRRAIKAISAGRSSGGAATRGREVAPDVYEAIVTVQQDLRRDLPFKTEN